MIVYILNIFGYSNLVEMSFREIFYPIFFWLSLLSGTRSVKILRKPSS